MDERRFEGKVVVITGAGAGIGRTAALAFAAEGASVAVMEVRGQRGQQTCDMIAEEGGTAMLAEADVTLPEQVEPAVKSVLDRFGRIDVLYNNAGTTRVGSVIECTIEEWDTVIDTNLKGTFLVSKAVLPAMIEQRSGAIINTGSVSGTAGDYRMCAYNAAKAAVINLTRAMALDFGPLGIRSNCICPGAIGTPWVLRNFSDEALAAMEEINPIRRIGEPREIAELALFLASPAASLINGSVIVADGGLTAWTGLGRR